MPFHLIRSRPASVAIPLGVIIVVSLCGGCGRRSATRPVRTFPARATVVLDGAPVAGAAVFFSPTSDGFAAYGVCDGHGVAQMTTFSPGDGAASGVYNVKVSKDEATRNPTINLPDPETDPDGYERAHAKMVAEGKALFDVTNLIPEKYRDYATSGLTADVLPQDNNEFRFDLSSKP